LEREKEKLGLRYREKSGREKLRLLVLRFRHYLIFNEQEQDRLFCRWCEFECYPKDKSYLRFAELFELRVMALGNEMRSLGFEMTDIPLFEWADISQINQKIDEFSKKITELRDDDIEFENDTMIGLLDHMDTLLRYWATHRTELLKFRQMVEEMILRGETNFLRKFGLLYEI
jgi:hypothetical protein